MAANRVNVPPGMLQWARKRSGRSVEDLIGRFPKLADWEAGRISPTMRQLEDYAQSPTRRLATFSSLLHRMRRCLSRTSGHSVINQS
jgi:hypothetical protein